MKKKKKTALDRLQDNVRAMARQARKEVWYIISAGLMVLGLLRFVEFLDKVLR